MMRLMNSRSCEVISSAPSYPFRNCSSQIRLSRSRWLLGSSSSITSGRIKRMRASATRIFQPPESAATAPSLISALQTRPDTASHHPRPEAEPRQRLAGPAVERVAVEFLETVLHLAIARDDLFHVVGA